MSVYPKYASLHPSPRPASLRAVQWCLRALPSGSVAALALKPSSRVRGGAACGWGSGSCWTRLDPVCQPKGLWALRAGINRFVQAKAYLAFPNYPKLYQMGFLAILQLILWVIRFL